MITPTYARWTKEATPTYARWTKEADLAIPWFWWKILNRRHVIYGVGVLFTVVTLPKFVLNHLPENSILSSTLSSLQIAWTGFNPHLCSSGSSSAGPTLVEIATTRSFILNRGIVTEIMSATPLEPGWWSVKFHHTKAVDPSAVEGPIRKNNIGGGV